MIHVTPDTMIFQINAVRRLHRLRPLRHDKILDRSAKRMSVYLASGVKFAHRSKIFGPRFHFDRLGECIAWNMRGTGATTVPRWMLSPGHRKLILSREYGAAGIGRASRGPRVFWTLHLGGQ